MPAAPQAEDCTSGSPASAGNLQKTARAAAPAVQGLCRRLHGRQPRRRRELAKTGLCTRAQTTAEELDSLATRPSAG
eukprot:5754153-Alexandrium_andersonii.AAC.1